MTIPNPPPLIDSRRQFHEGLRWLMDQASVHTTRSLWFVDRDFADWPLGDAAFVDALARWLRLPQRRLVLLAADYDEVPRRHPRFVTWRRDWSHAISPFAAPDDLASRLPHLAFGDTGLVLHLFDALHWRGRAGLDEQEARGWHDEIDAVLQRSEPAFPVQTLGL
jgi:hypothetical protein